MQITSDWFMGDHPNPRHPRGWIIDPRNMTVTIPASGIPHPEPVVLRPGDDISSWGHVQRHRPELDRALEIANHGRDPAVHLRQDVLHAVNRITRRYSITGDEFFLIAQDMSASMNAVINDEMERGSLLELQSWMEMEIEGRVNELIEMRSPWTEEGEPTLREVWSD